MSAKLTLNWLERRNPVTIQALKGPRENLLEKRVASHVNKIPRRAPKVKRNVELVLGLEVRIQRPARSAVAMRLNLLGRLPDRVIKALVQRPRKSLKAESAFRLIFFKWLFRIAVLESCFKKGYFKWFGNTRLSISAI